MYSTARDASSAISNLGKPLTFAGAIATVRAANKLSNVTGVHFGDAARGIDFWLLFLMQLAVFGGGVADNQNLALIFESEGDPAASGLGVALFSLASTLSRVSVGVLSDRYSETLSRFGWLIIVAFLGVVGQVLLSVMSAPLILAGTFVLGLSFGSFFTLVVPVVNEMYGQRQVSKSRAAIGPPPRPQKPRRIPPKHALPCAHTSHPSSVRKNVALRSLV